MIIRKIVMLSIAMQCGIFLSPHATFNNTIRRHTTPNPLFAQHVIFEKNRDKQEKKNRRINRRVVKNNHPTAQQ